VELVTIVFALEVLLDQLWLVLDKLIIESDLKNALSLIKNFGESPWQLRFYRNKLKNSNVDYERC
jgi:hypothetical protein